MIRVVLVDDEPQNCKSLAIKLKAIAEDIEIVGSFYHPDKALSGIRKIRPEVVFLDIAMPVMNGFSIVGKDGGF
jgi:YesN/AraC family two-component response regulator